jgi:hypothetical protein
MNAAQLILDVKYFYCVNTFYCANFSECIYLTPACRSSVSANLAIEKIKKEIPNAKGTQSSTFQTGITTECSMTFDILHHTLDGIYYTCDNIKTVFEKLQTVNKLHQCILYEGVNV